MTSQDKCDKHLETQRSQIDATPETRLGIDVIFGEGRKLRIVICDRSLLVRFGIYAMLEPIATIVGDASCGQSALDLVSRLNPDVVIIDTDLDVISGVEVCERIGRKTIVIVHASANEVSRHYTRLNGAGVNLFCLKSSGPDIIFEAIKHAAMDASYCDPTIAKHLPAGPEIKITSGPDRRGTATQEVTDVNVVVVPENEVEGELPASRIAEQAQLERHLEEAILRWHKRRTQMIDA